MNIHKLPLIPLTIVSLSTALYLGWQNAQENRYTMIDIGSVNVLNGNTIEYDTTRIRLLGYVVPDIHNAKCDLERIIGLAAKSRLSTLVRSAAQIKVSKTDLHDADGALMARAYVRRNDVGKILISEGLAQPAIKRRFASWCNKNRKTTKKVP